MSKRLAILGAGGHGKVVADTALATKAWSDIIFFDDAPNITSNGQWSVDGTGADLFTQYAQFDGVIVAIGNNEQRLKKSLELQEMGANLVSIIHPTAIVSPSVSIAPGCVLFAGSIINVDTSIEIACIVNTGAILEHDCYLYKGVHISPNTALAGGTKVGKCSWIGIGSVTKQLIVIGDHVVVGAGSVVVKSIPDRVTVVGNPATILKN